MSRNIYLYNCTIVTKFISFCLCFDQHGSSVFCHFSLFFFKMGGDMTVTRYITLKYFDGGKDPGGIKQIECLRTKC
jgi:hypothetical protein